MNRAVLALGSNLGNRRENMIRAISMLSDFCGVENRSYVYETPPVGFLEQPYFLNAALLVDTNLEPLELLSECKRIEREMGRKASFRNAPRTIDIDVIFYEDFECDTPTLTIPHPRWSSRAFVIAPLKDIFDDSDFMNSSAYFKKFFDDIHGRMREFERFCSL